MPRNCKYQPHDLTLLVAVPRARIWKYSAYSSHGPIGSDAEVLSDCKERGEVEVEQEAVSKWSTVASCVEVECMAWRRLCVRACIDH